MSVVLFDTHAFIKRLTTAGMPEAQAEVLADEHARLIDERLATKSDVAAVKSDLAAVKSDLAAVKSDVAGVKSDVAALATKLDAVETKLGGFATKDELKAAIAEAKSDIIKWTFGMIGFQTVLMLGAVLALVKTIH